MNPGLMIANAAKDVGKRRHASFVDSEALKRISAAAAALHADQERGAEEDQLPLFSSGSNTNASLILGSMLALPPSSS